MNGLKLSAITKRFGALVALDELSVEVRSGEVHGLIGPNGSGKTTAINIATGYYRPSSGTVWLNDRDVTDLPPHARAASGLGRSFQGARLFDQLDLRTNLRIAIEQRRRCLGQPANGASDGAEVAALLEQSHLSSFASTAVGRLPYGLRKQIELIRSCAFASSVLLLDEPTAGLSAEEVDRVLGIMTHHRSRLAILIVEHDMEVIMSVCDRITVIDAGRRLMTGTPAEVQRSPEVIAAYLGTDENAVEDAS